MTQRFDEAELLALIEDTLDPTDAQRLRQRLASEPEAVALIDRMREDRELLRSIPEPEVPGGLLAELEPILARPMLMPDLPARRRRRRPL
ncbi:MAG: anti-sigma factor family protein, partial [Planctomycetota bacterium]